MRSNISTRFSLPAFLIFILSTQTVLACEGDCIKGIVNVLTGNYSVVVSRALFQASTSLSQRFPSTATARFLPLLSPFLTAFQYTYPPILTNALFPNHFHGKCLSPSSPTVVPAGCPNPDCPVVCGTPGSLVHFYADVREIAYTNAKVVVERLCRPHHDGKGDDAVYGEVEDKVVRTVMERGKQGKRGEMRMIQSDGMFVRGIRRRVAAVQDENQVKQAFKEIMGKMSGSVEELCQARNGFAGCNWETEMKAYFLTFP